MYRLIIDGQYVPIPPEKISIKVDGDNKTMTLINLGEVNMLRNPKLTEISFDLLLPINIIHLLFIQMENTRVPMSTLRSIRNFYLPRRHLNWRFTDMLQIIKKYSILFLKCRWKDLQ